MLRTVEILGSACILALVCTACHTTDPVDASTDASAADGVMDASIRDAAANAPTDASLDARVPVDAGHDATLPSDAALDASTDAAMPDAATNEPLVKGVPVSEFFGNTCAGCHGAKREGRGCCPALIPSRLDKPRTFYEDTIYNGRPGTLMRSWADVLSKEEIVTIVDFLLTDPDPSSVIWELPDIELSRTVLIKDADLPTAPTHSGNLDNLMLVTERESKKFAVIDGDTNTVIGHVDSSYRAHGYAFHPLKKRWVYNLGRDGWLFKVDLFGLKPAIKVRVGYDSRGLAISDDGKYVIAGNFLPNTAVILNAVTLEPLKVIHAEGVNPDGEFVASRVGIVSDVAPSLVGPYFIIGLEEAGQVWRIDYSKSDFPVDKVVSAGRILHDGFLSEDNKRFFIASQNDNWMAAIDVEKWKLVDVIPTGISPHPGSGAVWKVGDVEYAATCHLGEGKVTIWEVATGNIAGSVPTAGPGLFIRANHTSRYVWADSMLAQPETSITVFDGESPTFDVVATINDGTMTLHPEFTADGSSVYVADWKENVVRVYDSQFDADAGTFPLITTIPDIPAPTGIFGSGRRNETLGH